MDQNIIFKLKNFFITGVIIAAILSLIPTITKDITPAIPTINFILKHIIEISSIIAFLLSIKFIVNHTKTRFYEPAIFFSLFLFFSSLAEIIYGYLDYNNMQQFPSIADASWIIGYFMLIYVCYLIYNQYKSYLSKNKKFYVFTPWAIIFLMVLIYLYEKIFSQNISNTEKIILILYPILDFIIILYVIYLLIIYNKRLISFFWMIMLIGVLSFTVGDILYAIYESLGIFKSGSFTDSFFTFEYLIFILGFILHFKEDIVYMAINPKTEDKIQVKGKPTYNLEYGNSYIVFSKKSDSAFDIFIDYIIHNHQGLCISRKNYDKLKKDYGLEKTISLWLTDSQSDKKTISPKNFEKINYIISEFLNETKKKSIIILDGVEYIFEKNNFNNTFNMLQILKDEISTKEAILLIPLNKKILTEKEMGMIEREFEII